MQTGRASFLAPNTCYIEVGQDDNTVSTSRPHKPKSRKPPARGGLHQFKHWMITHPKITATGIILLGASFVTGPIIYLAKLLIERKADKVISSPLTMRPITAEPTPIQYLMTTAYQPPKTPAKTKRRSKAKTTPTQQLTTEKTKRRSKTKTTPTQQLTTEKTKSSSKLNTTPIQQQTTPQKKGSYKFASCDTSGTQLTCVERYTVDDSLDGSLDIRFSSAESTIAAIYPGASVNNLIDGSNENPWIIYSTQVSNASATLKMDTPKLIETITITWNSKDMTKAIKVEYQDASGQWQSLGNFNTDQSDKTGFDTNIQKIPLAEKIVAGQLRFIPTGETYSKFVTIKEISARGTSIEDVHFIRAEAAGVLDYSTGKELENSIDGDLSTFMSAEYTNSGMSVTLISNVPKRVNRINILWETENETPKYIVLEYLNPCGQWEGLGYHRTPKGNGWGSTPLSRTQTISINEIITNQLRIHADQLLQSVAPRMQVAEFSASGTASDTATADPVWIPNLAQTPTDSARCREDSLLWDKDGAKLTNETAADYCRGRGEGREGVRFRKRCKPAPTGTTG